MCAYVLNRILCRTMLLMNALCLGDLERVRLSLQDSEAEKQTLRDRINDLVQSQQHLEQKATSLQLTVSSNHFQISIRKAS